MGDGKRLLVGTRGDFVARPAQLIDDWHWVVVEKTSCGLVCTRWGAQDTNECRYTSVARGNESGRPSRQRESLSLGGRANTPDDP